MVRPLQLSFENTFYRMTTRENLDRSLALYLIKHFKQYSLFGIGKIFKMDYSAIYQDAKRIERNAKQIKR